MRQSKFAVSGYGNASHSRPHSDGSGRVHNHQASPSYSPAPCCISPRIHHGTSANDGCDADSLTHEAVNAHSCTDCDPDTYGGANIDPDTHPSPAFAHSAANINAHSRSTNTHSHTYPYSCADRNRDPGAHCLAGSAHT